MHLEVRHLRLVRAIVAAGSLTSAGRTLHLTQSALSHQLADIEWRLGVRLFRRLGRRLALTAAGERVLALAGEILDRLDRTEAELRGLDGRCGPLRITVEGYTCYHWLPGLVRAYRARHADVDIQIDPRGADDPVRLLLDGRVDVAIIARRTRHPRVIERPLFDDRLVLVVAPGHALASRTSVRPEDFAGDRLFPTSAAGGSDLVAIDALVEFVKAELGVAVAPLWTVGPSVRQGLVRAVPVAGAPAWSWMAAHARDAEACAYVRDFSDLLVNRCGRRAPTVGAA